MSSIVYFAQADYGGPIKVGHTQNQDLRLIAIARDLPFKLVPIGTFTGGLFRERFVQCWFRERQIKGEWFEPSAELWRWALQARTTGSIHGIPDEPPWTMKLSLSFVRHRMGWLKITETELANIAGCRDSSIKSIFKQPFSDSKLFMAAYAVALARRGEELSWTDWNTQWTEARQAAPQDQSEAAQ